MSALYTPAMAGWEAKCRAGAAALAVVLLLAARPAAADDVRGEDDRSLVVTATAYNSLPGQTDEQPNVAAWGDRLEPGMKVIAVSSDLLELGLTRGARVSIEGLRGEYRVLDRMPAQWRERIDIYMGRDRDAALRWGEKRVRIRWRPAGSIP